MRHLDHSGNPASGIHDHALDLYTQAQREFACFRGDPVSTIEQATTRHPDFVMGWIMHAWLHALGTEPTAGEIVRADIAQAREHTPNERERAHLEALDHFIQGRWRRAGLILEALNKAWPRDGLALQAGHFVDLYRGDSRMLHDRIACALPHWSSADSNYHAILGMLAFGLEETGDYRNAEAIGRQALDLEPRDAWAHHAVTHVFEMQGRSKAGVGWMRERQPHWADDNFLSVHNWWHLAMFHLDRGEHDAVLELFDGPIHGARSELVLDLDDASALLWRLGLLGEDVASRWRTVVQCWDNVAEPGLNGFNDFHAMMAWIGAGSVAAAERCLAARTSAVTEDSPEAIRDVCEPLLRALMDLGEGRFGRCAEILRATHPSVHRIGGSHAQRDIVELTLIDAALQAGSTALARPLIEARMTRKPDSAINRTLLGRLTAIEQRSPATVSV